MASWPILSVTTFLPLLGAFFIVFLMMFRAEDVAMARNARWVAMWTTLPCPPPTVSTNIL